MISSLSLCFSICMQVSCCSLKAMKIQGEELLPSSHLLDLVWSHGSICNISHICSKNSATKKKFALQTINPVNSAIHSPSLLSQLYNKSHLTQLCLSLSMISSDYHSIPILYCLLSSAAALSGFLGRLLYWCTVTTSDMPWVFFPF